MDLTTATLISALLILTGAGLSALWLRETVVVSRTHTSPAKRIDGAEHARRFRNLLEETSRELMLYGDAGSEDGSLYRNDEVAAATLEKLKKSPGLKIDCRLDGTGPETVFERVLRGTGGVRIQRRSRPADDVHYEIADRRKAHVSNGDTDGSARNARTIDCSEAGWKAGGGTPPALKRYVSHHEAW